MISVEKARELIRENTDPIEETLMVPVSESSGHVLAEDILSPHDLPHFRQSSVDGYGIRLAGQYIQKVYTIAGIIKAGEHARMSPGENECLRIFTGAMVPDEVDMMLMQEYVDRAEDKIYINREVNTKVNHIREKGSQIRRGELSISRGQMINPSGIGFLCAMGIEKVKVFRKPRVSILTTGDELIYPGEIYQEGKVYESNSPSLKAALEKEGVQIHRMDHAKDSKSELLDLFTEILEGSDVVLVSGGISVGDYDYVSEVFKASGVIEIFHKVAQKPGKPLFFGRKNQKLIFGLPGNPASTLCCYYEYVIPCLRSLMHKENIYLKKISLPIKASLKKIKDLGVFYKAFVDENMSSVKLLEGQESFILKSFAQANALIYIPAGVENIMENEMVEVHFLPD